MKNTSADFHGRDFERAGKYGYGFALAASILSGITVVLLSIICCKRKYRFCSAILLIFAGFSMWAGIVSWFQITYIFQDFKDDFELGYSSEVAISAGGLAILAAVVIFTYDYKKRKEERDRGCC